MRTSVGVLVLLASGNRLRRLPIQLLKSKKFSFFLFLTCLPASQAVHECGLAGPRSPHEAGQLVGPECPRHIPQQHQICALIPGIIRTLETNHSCVSVIWPTCGVRIWLTMIRLLIQT